MVLAIYNEGGFSRLNGHAFIMYIMSYSNDTLSVLSNNIETHDLILSIDLWMFIQAREHHDAK